MRFGYYYDFRNLPRYHRDRRLIYSEAFEHMQAAERLGFASLWVAEHHLTEDGYNTAPFPMLAAMAARTSRVKLGTSVLLLPFHHPVVVAEEAAVVDNLSDGRLILGLGLGYRISEFINLGVDRKTRGARADEGIEIIFRCWTEDRFSYSGRYYQLRDVASGMKPVQQPHPPIVIGARSPKAALRAAHFGLQLMPMGDLESIYTTWAGAMAERGADTEAMETYSMVGVYPTDDPEREWAEIGDYIVEEGVSLRQWNHEAADSQIALQRGSGEDRQELARQERSRVIIGEPAYCVEQLRRWAAAAHVNHVILYKGLWSGLPIERALKHQDRFAREVLPQLSA
jgi:probable F420-dependent oxidoreductase